MKYTKKNIKKLSSKKSKKNNNTIITTLKNIEIKLENIQKNIIKIKKNTPFSNISLPYIRDIMGKLDNIQCHQIDAISTINIDSNIKAHIKRKRKELTFLITILTENTQSIYKNLIDQKCIKNI